MKDALTIAKLSQQAVKENKSIEWLKAEIGGTQEEAKYYMDFAKAALGDRSIVLSRPNSLDR